MIKNLENDGLETSKEYDGLKRLIDKSHLYDDMRLRALNYGYDSVCLRVNELVQELACLKAFDKTTNHYGDLEYWKRFYGNRAIRIYQILDELLGGIHNNDKPNL